MRPHLLDPTTPADPTAEEPPGAEDLVADLGLDLVLDVMGGGDGLVRQVCRAVLVADAPDLATIRYRQAVLADCFRAPGVAARAFDLLGEVLEDARHVRGSFLRGAGPVLDHSRAVLVTVLPRLRELRDLVLEQAPGWQSAGMSALAEDLGRDLDDAFFHAAADQLAFLEHVGGVRVRASLGPGLRPSGLTLVRPGIDSRGWLQRRLDPHPGELVYRLPERDEGGARALSELRDRALVDAADAVRQAAEHVLAFSRALRTELAFYLGCERLASRLAAVGVPTCLPTVEPDGAAPLLSRDLRDLALALAGEPDVVGNDAEADDAPLLVVTGANRGGKSTFLRSLGQAQILANAGGVTPAAQLRLARARRVLTHFRREEDGDLVRGRLADELRHVSTLVDELGPGDLVLTNEPFASTNEREGSELARQVFEPLLDAHIRVAMVTHLVDLATGWADRPPAPALFLRADPQSAPGRTFRLRVGRPMSTSHGVELADRILPAL